MSICEICGVNGSGAEAQIKGLKKELRVFRNLLGDVRNDRDRWQDLAQRMGAELIDIYREEVSVTQTTNTRPVRKDSIRLLRNELEKMEGKK